MSAPFVLFFACIGSTSTIIVYDAHNQYSFTLVRLKRRFSLGERQLVV